MLSWGPLSRSTMHLRYSSASSGQRRKQTASTDVYSDYFLSQPSSMQRPDATYTGGVCPGVPLGMHPLLVYRTMEPRSSKSARPAVCPNCFSSFPPSSRTTPSGHPALLLWTTAEIHYDGNPPEFRYSGDVMLFLVSLDPDCADT